MSARNVDPPPPPPPHTHTKCVVVCAVLWRAVLCCGVFCLQHDYRGPAGPASHHGDLQQHNALCLGLQHQHKGTSSPHCWRFLEATKQQTASICYSSNESPPPPCGQSPSLSGLLFLDALAPLCVAISIAILRVEMGRTVTLHTVHALPGATGSCVWRLRGCCLCCHQVIEPIQSRCAIVRFTKVSDADILARLQIVSGLICCQWDGRMLCYTGVASSSFSCHSHQQC